MAENQSQSGTEEQHPENILTEPSIGMVYDKEKDQASVFSQNPDGSIGTVEPTGDNEDLFFIMDRNIPANFYKNLQKYHNNPSINIYVFPRRALGRVKDALSRYWKRTTSDDVKLLYNYKMRPDGQFECKMKTYGIRDNEVPWDTLSRFGLSYGALEKTGNLPRLLNYEPSTMLRVYYSDEIISNMVGDAKLRLKGKGDNVKLTLKFHTKYPAKQLFGVPFTEEDEKNLARTGNLGRVFHTPEGPLLVSRDFDTQQYDWVAPDQAYIPKKLFGTEVDKKIAEALRNGQACIVPTKNANGDVRAALYQYNAIYHKVMEVLTQEQRNELARKTRNKNEVERIINEQPQGQNPGQQQAPTTAPEQTQTADTRQTQAQEKTQSQHQRQTAATKAPRPQVKAAEPKPGQRAGKHM